MAYPQYSNFMCDEDIKKKLKGITFMTDRSKKLVEYACKPDVENFAKILAKYVWLGTRDTTMVLMVTSVLMIAEKTKSDLKKYLDEMDITSLINLFSAMGKGDGQAAKSKLEKLKAFKYLFVYGILQDAIRAKDDSEKAKERANEQRQEIWKNFVTQVGKIKKWELSYDTVENNIVPILDKVLPPILAEAFKDGFNNLGMGDEEKTLLNKHSDEFYLPPRKFSNPYADTEKFSGRKLENLPPSQKMKQEPKKESPKVKDTVKVDVTIKLIEDMRKSTLGWWNKGSFKVEFDKLARNGNNGVKPKPILDNNEKQNWVPVLRAFEKGFVEMVRFKKTEVKKDLAAKVFDYYEKKFGKGDPFTKEMYDFMKDNGQQVKDYHK